MALDSVGTTHSNPAYSQAAQDDIESDSGSESNSCIGKGGWVTQCFKWPLRHPYLALGGVLGSLIVTAGAAYGFHELSRAGAGDVGTVGTLLANRTITSPPATGLLSPSLPPSLSPTGLPPTGLTVASLIPRDFVFQIMMKEKELQQAQLM
ncbi:hypothetical protein [Endozoicomonas sp.]|uniref:hypothetical protein n=1 Tax=Endozoicomonas sp. TaxID=1892382 RepID=UPI002887A6D4|nr:hypothetical protein [Endozoicomonas sp.]